MPPRKKAAAAPVKKTTSRKKAAPKKTVSQGGRFGGYGYVPDAPDVRDFKASKPRAVDVRELPPAVDLRLTGHLPPVYHQGQLGSCTANAIGALMDYINHVESGVWFYPSRLFVYYEERVLEGTVGEDSGAMIRDGMKVVNKLGVCPEGEWPYNVERFTERPTDQCYTNALAETALVYERVYATPGSMKTTLANGWPVVVGIAIHPSFETNAVAATGMVPMPAAGEKIAGWHAILVVGYDDERKVFICRNSWGPAWGDHGYFYLPYDYLMNSDFAGDFWTASKTGPVVQEQIAKAAAVAAGKEDSMATTEDPPSDETRRRLWRTVIQFLAGLPITALIVLAAHYAIGSNIEESAPIVVAIQGVVQSIITLAQNALEDKGVTALSPVPRK